MNIIDYLRQIICILDGIISLIIWQFFDPWIFFGESNRKCAVCHSLYRSRHCRKYHFCSILQHDRARCVVGRSFWCDIWISRCSCSNIFILQRTTTEIRWIWNLSNFIGKFAFGSLSRKNSPHKSGQSKQMIMVLENIKTFFTKIITKHIFI